MYLLMANKRSGSKYFMMPDERRYLAALPGSITVYRGYQGKHQAKGLSWTLDKERAEWFARRWGGLLDLGYLSYVAERTVGKKDIFAYINSRQEQEIILRPETFTKVA
jgi:hypothetical protein